MCVTGMAYEFYKISGEKKYYTIMESAAKTAKLHFDNTNNVFMEEALLSSGLDFTTPSGRLCNPGIMIGYDS